MANLTLEDVAKKAGVSRSTVSRVINNSPDVNESVRKHIQDIIKKTGYQPHAAARSLALQRSYMIGLVLPRTVSNFFTDPYFPRLTQGIAQACNQFNYTLALFVMDTNENEDRISPRISKKGMLDGIIIQTAGKADRLTERLIKSELPVVIAGRPFQTNDVSYVDVDNFTASYEAVTHLIKIGYRRIGTITGLVDSTPGVDRYEGYQKAITDHGWQVDEKLVTQSDFTEKGGYTAMKRLLPNKPDAIFAASDTMACGAIRAVREEGLKVPGDVAFIGFDDLPIAATPEFMLTTVRQPIVQFGAKAVEILIDLIENGNKPSRCVIMDTELIIRKSCGAVYKNGHSNGGNQAQDFWNAVGPNRIISPYNHEEVENKR